MTAESACKDAYHHGNLAAALVDAASNLVAEQGVENFTLADASRVAGVSKGAPYRHFENKDALLFAVGDAGFHRLEAVAADAMADKTPGSNQRIFALGLAYIAFAVREPAIFRLMFSTHCTPPCGQEDYATDQTCFRFLLQELQTRTRKVDCREVRDLAVALWTLVHGAATLIIDDRYTHVDPDGDIQQMLYATTVRILADYPEPE